VALDMKLLEPKEVACIGLSINSGDGYLNERVKICLSRAVLIGNGFNYLHFTWML